MKLRHGSPHIESDFNLNGHKALIITTRQTTLDKFDEKTNQLKKSRKSTGVYASEMTEAPVFLQGRRNFEDKNSTRHVYQNSTSSILRACSP